MADQKILQTDERNELVRIISALDDFGQVRDRKEFAKTVGIGKHWSNVIFEGQAKSVAGDLVDIINKDIFYGQPSEGCRALGRLIDVLLDWPGIGVSDQEFMATLVLNYRLVPDRVYLDAPDGFEKFMRRSMGFVDPEQWRERMSLCEVAVCRVEVPDGSLGTGFLVGPDLVMTNHHVIKEVSANAALLEGVVLRFDYKTGPDGAELRPSQTYRLAANWLEDSSCINELDYALIRTKGTPGQDPVGGQKGAPQRGWLRPVAHEFRPEELILILQHPAEAPLKFAAGSLQSVIAEGKRVTYTANTLPGSSGSPCFTAGWDLVALHHRGDQAGNEGIAFSAIMDCSKVKTALGLVK